MKKKFTKNLKIYLIGIVSGFFSGALGSGGGLINVPCLVIFLDYKLKKAIGTSLVVVAPTVSMSILIHLIIKNTNFQFFSAIIIILGSIIGVKIGVKIVKKINAHLLKNLFITVLFLGGLKLSGVIGTSSSAISNFDPISPLLIIIGIIAGIFSVMFGLGGGVVIVPTLNLLFGFSIHEAIATSLLVVLPTAATGAFMHYKMKNVDINIVKLLIPAAFFGAIFGAVLSNLLPSDIVKKFFSIFMIAASIKLFYGTRAK